MKKGVLTLALLVSVLLLVNTLFIFMIEQSRTGSIEDRIAKTFTGYNQLEIFSKPVLEKYAPVEDKITDEEITKTSDVSDNKEEIVEEVVEEETAEEVSPPTVAQENQELIKLPNGKEMILDYNKKTIIYDGREISAIVDDVVGPNGETIPIDLDKDTKDLTWVHLPYDRFDVYIEENYYNANTPALDTFFDQFEPRYELMETTTGWSSEQFYGQKLKINVTGSTVGGCYGGWAYPSHVWLILSEPLYMQGCGDATMYNGVPSFGNPGELGDWWPYMGATIHEVVHAINPLPIFYRGWITEGFAEYNEYNILSEYGDINQETADYEIYDGTSYYNWEDYIANDYHDTSPSEAEIQNSPGYDITAWMYSMMRDDYGMQWNTFYNLLNNNLETLDEADSRWQISDYFTDMVVIDIFGKSVDYTFSEIKEIWEYDGPSGPGWGVRQWVDTSWYADLSPVLSLAKTPILPGEDVTFTGTIYNYGEVNLEDVVVRFYKGEELIDEQIIDVGELTSVVVSTSFSSPVEGSFEIKVVVDEDNVKMESNETNNQDSEILVVAEPQYICGDTNNDKAVNVLDIVYLVDYKFKGGSAPLCSPMQVCADVNHDNNINVLDIVYLVNYKFKSGPAPDCG